MENRQDLNAAMSFGRLIRLYHQKVNRLFAREGLGRGQSPILLLLLSYESMNQSQMAALLGISPATVTVTLKRMEAAGLVMREVDRGDQRAMRVCLSPKGREICVQGRRCMHEMVQSMLEDFRPEEIRRFTGYLGRVEANLLRQETGHEADREQPASDG